MRALRQDGCPALGQRGTISQAIPNDIDPNVNTTIPWELQASLQRAHDDFWRAHYPPHGEIPPDIVGKPLTLGKHYDLDEPDPDTGLFPGQKPMPRLDELQNQTAVQTLLALERDFGPGSVQTQRWLGQYMDEALATHIDNNVEPHWTDPEPTESEIQWCQEPLAELHEWAFEDMCAYYDRSRNWENWTESEEAAFNSWADTQQKVSSHTPTPRLHCFQHSTCTFAARTLPQKPGIFTHEHAQEYERRELAAFDLYAKRRGYMGCKDPVRWKDLAPNDTTTPWVDFLSEDDDPDIHPEWPWNQPPTEEELWRFGGPMRDHNATELRALMAKGAHKMRLGPAYLQQRRRRGDDDDDDNSRPSSGDA